MKLNNKSVKSFSVKSRLINDIEKLEVNGGGYYPMYVLPGVVPISIGLSMVFVKHNYDKVRLREVQ